MYLLRCTVAFHFCISLGKSSRGKGPYKNYQKAGPARKKLLPEKKLALLSLKLKNYWPCYRTLGGKSQWPPAVSHILSLTIDNQQNVKNICFKSINNT